MVGTDNGLLDITHLPLAFDLAAKKGTPTATFGVAIPNVTLLHKFAHTPPVATVIIKCRLDKLNMKVGLKDLLDRVLPIRLQTAFSNRPHRNQMATHGHSVVSLTRRDAGQWSEAPMVVLLLESIEQDCRWQRTSSNGG